MHDRMPPLSPAQMTPEQQQAAAELAAGPRKGVFGPFIPLMRSPELMDRLQKVGEYLRFRSSLEPRLNEFAMMVVSRAWTQQFEWAVHYPLALKAGLARETADSLAAGRRPAAMRPDEALVYDFYAELERTRGVSDATYREAVALFGERGVMDLLGLVGYFTTLSMVLNVARTPPQPDAAVGSLTPFPA
jgi:4-carboxymuconolactone decarboxylase